MIKIVDEEKLKTITLYNNNTEITPSNETYSYPPLELLSLSNNKTSIVKYLIRLKNTLDYLVQLFQLIQYVKQTDISISKEQNKETYLIEETKTVLSGIEKDLYIEMLYGKNLLPKCQQLLQCNLLSQDLRDWIIKKENYISNINETSDYNPKYTNTNINELDIYRFMCTDLLYIFSKEIAKYFTTSRFFSNTGFSYFTLDEDLYSYFIGTIKGYLPNIENIPNFRIKYVEEYYDRLFHDFHILTSQISETLDICKTYPVPTHEINSNTTNFIIEKFFDTHEAPKNIFDYLEQKGMIKKNTDGLFTLINNYQTQVITFFCYICKTGNPEYDLYKQLFINFKRNNKEEYKKNRTKNSEYMKSSIIPLLNEIKRGV